MILLLPAATLAEGFGNKPWTIHTDARWYEDNVSGNRAQSSRYDGNWYLNAFTFNYADSIRDGLRLSSNVQLQNTNDTRVSHRDFRLNRAFVTLERPNLFRVTAGDYLASYTPYSLTRAAEGIDAAYIVNRPEARIELKGNIGRVQRAMPQRSFDRWIAGMRIGLSNLTRLHNPVLRSLSLGYNVAMVKDASGSLADRGGLTPAISLVHSVDLRALLPYAIQAQAEMATSDYSANRDTSERQRSGTAFRLSLQRRWRFVESRLDFENVATDFTTLSGSAAADQRRTNLMLRYRPHSRFSIRGTSNWSRDNLSRTRAATNQTANYDLAAVWVPLPDDFSDLELEFGYRRREQTTSTLSVKRFRDAPFAGVRTRILGWNASMNLTWEENENRIAPANNSRGTQWNTDLSRLLEWKELSVRPSFSYSRSSDRTVTPANETINQSTRAALGVEWKRLSATTSYGYQHLDRSDRTQRNHRHTLEASLGFRPLQEHDLRLEMNARKMLSVDRVGQANYRETRLELRGTGTF